ncbi:MAG: hypothetical protein FJ087_17060, partial [Deltaproteobacteria bacterium]|nr:hypothetical protein [Deltaproteobacteria bacterium]
VYRDGSTFDPPAEKYLLTNGALGSMLPDGTFVSVENVGGESYVTVTTAGACGSAKLRVVQTWSHAGDSGLDPAAVLPGTLEPDVGGAGAPELAYPPGGAMLPADFPPLAVQFTASSFGPLGIVRFEAPGARADFLFDPAKAKKPAGYVVTLDRAFQEALPGVDLVESFTVSVLSVDVSGDKTVGTPVASEGRTLYVTREQAGGAFFYWNTAGQGSIRLLELGKDKSEVLKMPVGGCIGCHSISPDAEVIAVSPFIGGGFSSFNLVLAYTKNGKEPDWVHTEAKAQYSKGFTIAPAFSPAYWGEADKRIVVPSTTGGGMMGGKPGLFGIDLLKGTVTPLIKGGDAGAPAFPAWSPNGKQVVYTTAKSDGTPTSFAINGASKLYKVPYEDGAGGQAEPLAGADAEGILQYYPVFTPDGAYVAFNVADESTGGSCPAIGGSGGAPPSGGTYDNCKAEVFMVPAGGGMPVRLGNANGPGSPGVANSWPTFGQTAGRYYWLAFASRREYGVLHTGGSGGPPSPQIWIAAVDPGRLFMGMDGSFAALWLPGQEMESGNHIARWGVNPRQL